VHCGGGGGGGAGIGTFFHTRLSSFSVPSFLPPTASQTASSCRPAPHNDGYVSDGGEAFFFRVAANGNGPVTATTTSTIDDDGYLSEGGASFYARKIQNRIAFEKQKEVEEQRNRLHLNGGRGAAGLPEVLGGGGGAVGQTANKSGEH
jgi:hypothetical protein